VCQCSKCDGKRRYGVPLLFPEMKNVYRHFSLLFNGQNAPKCIDSHIAFQKFPWGDPLLRLHTLDPRRFTLAARTRGFRPLDRPPHSDYITPTYLFSLRALGEINPGLIPHFPSSSSLVHPSPIKRNAVVLTPGFF
jgi:hypothetical protein